MRIILFANTDWYLYNFRLPLAEAVRDAGHEVILISPPGPFCEKLRSRGFEWIEVPMLRRSLNPLRELRLLVWLLRLFRSRKPDIVHSFTIKPAVYGSLAARLAGIPARVNAVAGMGYVFTSGDAKARLLRPFVRLALRIALGGKRTRLILQNPDDVEFFAKNRLVSTNLIRLIPGSGVDCERFTPHETVNTFGPSRPTTFLLAARLLWDKGVGEYLEAARTVLASGRRASFLLAGEPDPGNPTTIPLDQILKWHSDGDLNWLGQVEDMPALLREVDVAVLPSYREGLPKGLVEAAACGLSIITTDVPGCRAVVNDRVDGILVPARDVKALVDAIALLIDEPKLRHDLGRKARKKAVELFSTKKINSETLRVYVESMQDKSK